MIREALTEGYDDRQLWREVEAINQRVKDLSEKTDSQNESLLTQLNDLNAFINLNVPPVVNYIDNGDFVFEQEDYEAGTNYTDDNLDCAKWYYRLNNSNGQYTEHTTSVRSNDHVSTNTGRDAWWDKTSGQLVMGTRAAPAQPMPKNLAFPAGTLFCRFQIKKSGGGITIPDSWRLRAAIWDNTSGQQKIVEGAVFDLTVNAANPSPGAITRKYILRVDTNMDFFYSDVLTPSQVTNQVSVDVIDNVNFVAVSWMVFSEATSYKLYRHDSASGEWRQIAEIRNGATSFKDVGGRVGLPLFTPPGANILPRAQALFVNFGEYVTTEFKDAIFNIFVPTSYNYALTTNKQWLRLDMVDENLNDVILPDDALVIDKLCLGYTNGRFCYSSRDLAAQAAVTATTPPPVPPPGGGDGEGGGTPPNPGGGGGPISCVKPDTKILVVEDDLWVWRPASEVEVGDHVVNVNKGYSKVTEVLHGVTSRFHVLTTKLGNELWCSPSHKILQPLDRTGLGVSAFTLKVGDKVLVMMDTLIEWDEIIAIEIIDTPNMSSVITFKLDGENTYIADRFVSHNLKPLLE